MAWEEWERWRFKQVAYSIKRRGAEALNRRQWLKNQPQRGKQKHANNNRLQHIFAPAKIRRRADGGPESGVEQCVNGMVFPQQDIGRNQGGQSAGWCKAQCRL